MAIARRALGIALFAFLFFPVGLLFGSHPGALSMLFDPTVLRTVALTFGGAVAALALATVLAIPLALTLFHRRSHASRAIQMLLEMLWVWPSFLFVLLTLWLLKCAGVESIYSFASVILGWVLIGLPFLAVQILNGLRDLDPREREALRTLGASGPREIFLYDLPRVRPVMTSALLHQFWLYLVSFTMVVLLNGGPPNETLEVAIYHAVRLDRVDWNLAVAFSFWQALMLIGARMLLRFNEEESRVGWEWFSVGRSSKLRKAILGISLLVSVFFFARAGEDLREAIEQGFLLSGLVAALTLLFALGAWYARIPAIAGIGGWFSPMVVSLAWWKFARFSAPVLMICALVQMVLLAPWMARTLYPLLKRARRFELEAVRTLGSGPIQAWWLVEWPRLRPTILWLTALTFALSLAEVGTVILFSSSEFNPLSLWIQDNLSRFQLDAAFKGTLLLMLIASAAVLGGRADDEV